MHGNISLEDIQIRTELQPGDIGYVTYMHGHLYKKEYDYGIQFEAYVAAGLYEFYNRYDPLQDCVWVCEHHDHIIGFMLLMHREPQVAQLRYFIIEPSYRNIGLGKKLMSLYVEFLQQKGYRSSFLWTTAELHAAAALYMKFGFVLMEEKPSTAFGKPVMQQRYERKM